MLAHQKAIHVVGVVLDVQTVYSRATAFRTKPTVDHRVIFVVAGDGVVSVIELDDSFSFLIHHFGGQERAIETVGYVRMIGQLVVCHLNRNSN